MYACLVNDHTQVRSAQIDLKVWSIIYQVLNIIIARLMGIF